VYLLLLSYIKKMITDKHHRTFIRRSNVRDNKYTRVLLCFLWIRIILE